jgi:hypothetical protein
MGTKTGSAQNFGCLSRGEKNARGSNTKVNTYKMNVRVMGPNTPYLEKPCILDSGKKISLTGPAA